MQERHNSIANALELRLSCTKPSILVSGILVNVGYVNGLLPAGTKPLPDPMVMYHQWDPLTLNTLRPRQNGRHFADIIFKCIFLNENVWISIEISLKFIPKGPMHNIPALVQIMACADQATSHYLHQWWLIYWRIYTSLGLTELTLNMLNCFKDNIRYIHILNRLLDLARPKMTKLTLEPQYMLPVLHSQYHAC